eukprot:3941740-Rhodomonas_salina.2
MDVSSRGKRSKRNGSEEGENGGKGGSGTGGWQQAKKGEEKVVLSAQPAAEVEEIFVDDVAVAL